MEENSKNNYLHNKNIQDAILFLILAAGLLVYSLINHYGSIKMEWKTSPYLFPVLVAVFIFALSISLIAEGTQQIKSNAKTEQKAAAQWKSVAFTIVVSIIYYVIMRFITFIPATILFLVAMFLYLGERRKWLMALISIISSLAIYVIFDVLLHVMLP